MDIRKTQANLGARVDGNFGRESFGKLLAIAAGRPVDSNIERVAQGLAKYAGEYGLLDSRERLCDFIAQISHETGGFKRFEENLNYSAQGLANTWPGRYAVNASAKVKVPNAKAKALARRPEAIANDTYALRMGNQSASNDNDTSPDGWQYRGRGPNQLTGKSNYEFASGVTGLDLIKYPDLAADPFTGAMIALAFAKKKGIFAAADRGDFRASRRAWNGGLLGFDEITTTRGRLMAKVA